MRNEDVFLRHISKFFISSIGTGRLRRRKIEQKSPKLRLSIKSNLTISNVESNAILKFKYIIIVDKTEPNITPRISSLDVCFPSTNGCQALFTLSLTLST